MTTTAYATVEDLESRWRELSTDKQTLAGTLLADASAELAQMVDVDADDETQAELLKIVTCNMVKRQMSSIGSDAFGVTTQSMSAVGFSQSQTYANPTGERYLTKYERKLLGIGGSYIGSISPLIGWGADDDD